MPTTSVSWPGPSALASPCATLGESTKAVITDLSHGVSTIVKAVIRCRPAWHPGPGRSHPGETGFDALFGYAQLLVVLIGCMLFIAFVVNPLIVFWKIKRNPILKDLPERRRDRLLHPQLRRQHPGSTWRWPRTAPAGRHLCVSIPAGCHHQHGRRGHHHLVLSMAAVHSAGMEVDLAAAGSASVVRPPSAPAALRRGRWLPCCRSCWRAACLASATTSPCRVVAVGFIIGVLQDSPRTALNSSTDVPVPPRPPAWPRDESLLDAWPGSQPRSLIRRAMSCQRPPEALFAGLSIHIPHVPHSPDLSQSLASPSTSQEVALARGGAPAGPWKASVPLPTRFDGSSRGGPPASDVVPAA